MGHHTGRPQQSGGMTTESGTPPPTGQDRILLRQANPLVVRNGKAQKGLFRIDTDPETSERAISVELASPEYSAQDAYERHHGGHPQTSPKETFLSTHSNYPNGSEQLTAVVVRNARKRAFVETAPTKQYRTESGALRAPGNTASGADTIRNNDKVRKVKTSANRRQATAKPRSKRAWPLTESPSAKAPFPKRTNPPPSAHTLARVDASTRISSGICLCTNSQTRQ